MPQRKESELTVISKAKDMCSYIMTATQKSPKHFRYTFVSRLQNLSLGIIEGLFRANDTYVNRGDVAAYKRRLEFQQRAMTDLKLLAYFSLLAMEQGCILPKQFEQISQFTSDCRNLLAAWMTSDRKRLIIQG